jgi:hypothetical protein
MIIHKHYWELAAIRFWAAFFKKSNIFRHRGEKMHPA